MDDKELLVDLYSRLVCFRDTEEKRKRDPTLFESDQYHAAGAAAAYNITLAELLRRFPSLLPPR